LLFKAIRGQTCFTPSETNQSAKMCQISVIMQELPSNLSILCNSIE